MVRVAVVAPASKKAYGVTEVDDNGRDGSTSSNAFCTNQSGSTSVVDSSTPDAGACAPATAQYPDSVGADSDNCQLSVPPSVVLAAVDATDTVGAGSSLSASTPPW